MPLKASPDDQALLLELQSIDTKIQQLTHRANTLPEIATIVALKVDVEELRIQLVSDRGALEDADSELKRVESDVELVETRIVRDEERLNSTSSVKDVAGLDAELASLRKRRSDLEDIQLSVMERIEELDATAVATAARHDGLVAQLTAAESDRDRALATLNGEMGNARANRATIAAKVPVELLALYERQRERYGSGASMLRGGVSSASGVKLNESDMAAIRAAAQDDVVLCPDSNAILVRTSESGL